MAKRVRRFSISRNNQYETYQLDGQGQLVSIWNSVIRIGKKKLNLKRLNSNRICRVLSSLIFHDRDLTSDGERRKDCIVTWF